MPAWIGRKADDPGHRAEEVLEVGVTRAGLLIVHVVLPAASPHHSIMNLADPGRQSAGEISQSWLCQNVVGRGSLIPHHRRYFIHMARLHFIGGEKGGVGKSVVARVLAQYFIDRQIPFLGFDTDKSHGSLLRFYGDFAAPAVIDRFEGLDRVVEAATEQPDRRVIVDLAAQTHRFLAQWMEESALLDISSEMDLTIHYWHVMDSGRDSADLLVKVLDQFGGRLPLVVVLNEVRGGDFAILESSGALARAKELGATTITLRKLQDTTMQKIDAHSASFWAASNRGKDGSALGLLERQRVKNWLHRAYEEIARLDP
jgi:hypothetical protein